MTTRWFIVKKFESNEFVPYYKRDPSKDYVNATSLLVTVNGDLIISGPAASKVYKSGDWVKATVVSSQESVEHALSLMLDKGEIGAYYL